MRCPSCDTDNIAGTEHCESCGSDLAGLDIPEASGGGVGRLVRDQLGDLELRPPIIAAADETVEAVVRRMRQARQGCVHVLDGDRPIGIFSERDVMSRVLLRGLDTSTTTVGQVMTPRPTTLSVGDPPAHAIHRMVSQGFRHLPITRDGELAGSISVRDLLRYIDGEILGADPTE
jgi:CBS domain-containing protein